MSRKNKTKGFSLVEILAAIVILGLLSTIAIVSVNYILGKAEQEYYKSQKDEIILAAKSYTQDNRNSLPKRMGMRTEIKLSTLQAKKYIGKVVDRHKNECDANETIVQVFKYDKTHYSYSVTLVCPSYKITENAKANAKSEITFEYAGITSENINYKNVKATITMKDEDKIASYNYVVYRNGTEVKNSGDIEGKLKKEIKITVPLEKYIPGDIEIKVVVTDQLGAQETKTSSKSIRNENSPKCEVIKENTEWTNQPPVEISVKCISNSNKGCKKDVYTQVFNSSAEKGTILMEDKEGNLGDCTTDVKIDMEPPSTPVIDNPYHDIWVNKNYTIKITSVDETSGIKQFEYRYPNSTKEAADGKPENEWHVWENSSKKAGDKTPFETTEFKRERGEVLEVRAVDNAGNYSKVATTIIKIDKTAPTILTINNPYLNTWFNKAQYDANNNAYVITITSQDNLSGISYHQYKYPNSTNSWKKYDNSGNPDESTNKEKYTFVTTPFKNDRDEKVLFQVCDRAGNCSEGDSYIKLDRTPPAITISNPYPNWFNKTAYNSNQNAFKITSTAKDETSGLASHDYKHSDESSWTTKDLTSTSAVKSDKIQTGPYKTEMNKSITFRAYDIAGNYTDASTSIRVDITSPSCSVSVTSGTKGNSNWYITNPKLSLSHSDSYSGVSCYGLSSSSNVTCGSTDSGTQSNTKGTTWHGIVQDNAGNTTTCSSETIKVDTTAPNCSIKVDGTKGNSNWYISSNPKLTLSHSDDYSGVSCYGLSSSSNVTCGSTDSGTQSNTKGTTWYGIVKDNAGNVANCDSGSIKVDTTAPSTPTYTARYKDGTGTYTSGSMADRIVVTDISSTDEHSGIEGIYCSTNKSSASKLDFGVSALTQNGNTWTGTESWSFTSGRNDTYYFQARDRAGNKSGWSSKFNIKYVKLYTVSYNANGGTGAPDSQTKKQDIDLTLRTTKPTRSDYAFLGWGTTSTTSTVTYKPGGTYKSNSNITLYAVWEKIDTINGNRCASGNKYYITTCTSSTCNYTKLNGNTASGTIPRNTLKYCTVTLSIDAPSSAVCSGKQIKLTCTASGGMGVTATIVDNGYKTGGTSSTAYATLNTTRNGNIATTFTCTSTRGDTKSETHYYTVKSCSSGGGSTCTSVVYCLKMGASVANEAACKSAVSKAGGTTYHYGRGDCYGNFCNKCPTGWLKS